MRQRYIIFLLALLVLAGCHRKQQKNDESTATEYTTDSTEAVSPTSPDSPGEEPQAPQLYKLEGDTATRVDFAAFRRRQTVFYTAEQIAGEWVQGTLHEEYHVDGTGLSWDTGDDVSREEGKQFRWTLDSNQLRVMYPISTGGVVPRDYFVTFADDESLVYKDEFGSSHMWDKTQ